jgi:hypothetical protein
MCAQGQAEGGTQQNAYQAESPAGPPQDGSTASAVITEHRLAVIRAGSGAARGDDRGGVVTASRSGQLSDRSGAPRRTDRGEIVEIVTRHRLVHVWDESGAPRCSDRGEVVIEHRPVQLQ